MCAHRSEWLGVPQVSSTNSWKLDSEGQLALGEAGEKAQEARKLEEEAAVEAHSLALKCGMFWKTVVPRATAAKKVRRCINVLAHMWCVCASVMVCLIVDAEQVHNSRSQLHCQRAPSPSCLNCCLEGAAAQVGSEPEQQRWGQRRCCSCAAVCFVSWSGAKCN